VRASETARENASRKVREFYATLHQEAIVKEAADEASEVWEPIARTFRAHLPYQGLVSTRCRSCDQPWPCPEWKRADEELGLP
jgi:hypothetical protein